MAVVDLVDEVIGVGFPDDPAGVVAVVKDLITLRNAVEARLAADCCFFSLDCACSDMVAAWYWVLAL